MLYVLQLLRMRLGFLSSTAEECSTLAKVTDCLNGRLRWLLSSIYLPSPLLPSPYTLSSLTLPSSLSLTLSSLTLSSLTLPSSLLSPLLSSSTSRKSCHVCRRFCSSPISPRVMIFPTSMFSLTSRRKLECRMWARWKLCSAMRKQNHLSSTLTTQIDTARYLLITLVRVLKRACVEVSACWSERVLKWVRVEVSVCWSECVLKWVCVELSMCWSEYVLKRACVEVSVCWIECVLTWSCVEVKLCSSAIADPLAYLQFRSLLLLASDT